MELEFDTTNWRMDKVLGVNEAEKLAAELKTQNKKLVTVNGSFDLVHAGHLDQLEEAKRQGDVLWVGLNSDKSVREGKGEARPLVPELARAAMLAALSCVDYVVIIDEPYDEVQDVLIRTLKPDVHVNGPDYGEVESWIEYPVMQEVGATGFTVQRRNDLSTSEILKRVNR